jgi:tetratricopeptide (TPR) repeat protein
MLLGLATAQYTGGSFEQAAQSFFSASDLNPNDPVPYDFLNRVKDPVIKNSAGYCQRFMRFAKLKPENALANYYYAECLWQQRTGPADIEAYNRALSLLTKAISLDPHLDSAYLALGIIHADQRNYAKAATAYQMAIKENPKLEEAHYRLSEAYRVLGDRKEADIELAAFRKLSEQSASKLERERKEVQQFVIALKNTAQ